MKILVSASPIFLLKLSATMSLLKGKSEVSIPQGVSGKVKVMFLDYSLLSPIVTVAFIPIYLLLIKPYFLRYIPSMLKRIGWAYSLSCVIFLLFLIADIVSFNTGSQSRLPCSLKNTSHIINHNFIAIPRASIAAVHIALLALVDILFYISAWEFISCQCPQSMKGITFGLFYALQGFHQCIGAALMLLTSTNWNSEVVSCHTVYCLFHGTLAVILFLLYVLAARSYHYRKRDDICNFYQFAENYYSKSCQQSIAHNS